MRYIFSAIMLILIASQPVQAKMYKWVDEKGVTQYGDSIPAQYAPHGNTELSKSGAVLKKTDAMLTPEQIKAKEDADTKKKEDAKNAMEKERKDKALLDSYTNEKEIDMARERNLQLADVSIQGTQTRLKPAQAKLDKIHVHIEALKKSKRPIPADLTEDLLAAEKAVVQLNNAIKLRLQEKETIRARYEAEKLHYRELKHMSPQPTAKP